MRITITNQALGKSTQANCPEDGIFTAWQASRIRRALVPPGYSAAGALGENGPQRPPEVPGWEYSFEKLEDGRVKATPARIREAAGVRG